MQKGTRAVPGKQKASVIELVVDNSKIVVKLNIANQRKKLWLLAGIGSGQKEISGFFFKYMEFLLTNVDKVCIEVQKTLWQRRWKTYTRFLTSTQNI